MAKRTVTVMVDDLDGSEATQHVTFALDGLSYGIDLNDENAAALRAAMAPWLHAARREAGSRPTVAQAQARSRQQQFIREWGIARGWEVSDRGRVPKALREAFYADVAAQNEKAAAG